jgi:hypothetical protein
MNDGSGIGDPNIFILLREETSEKYTLSVLMRNLELIGITNPLPLGLVIGNDQGTIEQRLARVLFKVP